MATHTISSSMMPTSTTAAPSATPTNGDSGGGPTSKPLLFFVALGFGVVFTNLWIIVGVKYCFRYNARARQMADENGEPIDLSNIPQRPRRRREKKLMTMDEVNERFPLIKYKLWRATRAQEGLPTEGGVTAPPSRAASIKDLNLARLSTQETASGTTSRDATATSDPASDTRDFAPLPGPYKEVRLSTADTDISKEQPTVVENVAKDGDKTRVSTTERPVAETPLADEEDEDPIRTALPTSVLEQVQPGDSCAICLESLEEDDEVRGLTCGHAFHASCVDPWLTNRRACCPLCKADYYVPKPQPDRDQQAAQLDSRTAQVPSHPREIFLGGRLGPYRPRMLMASSRPNNDNSQTGRRGGQETRRGWPYLQRDGNRHSSWSAQQQRRTSQTQQPQNSEAQPSEQSAGRFARIRQTARNTTLNFPGWITRHSNGGNANTQSEAQATPGQLESGTTRT